MSLTSDSVVLSLLLDEQISYVLVDQVRIKRPEIAIEGVLHWREGAFVGAKDPVLLAAAHGAGLTLVTFDQRTIRPLLKEWSETGIPHGGVIFVDERTIAQNNVGGLLRALCGLWDVRKDDEWTNRVLHLKREGP